MQPGYDHTCATLDNGRIRCWGDGSQGQHGYPLHPDPIGDDETPASMNRFVVLGARVTPQPGLIIGPPIPGG